jgi:ArsR family transcriptional regulator, arsenate/arsenite/antimonite-responsive transcriptional repressor
MARVKRTLDPDARLLQAAADPARLAILRQLAAADGPVCACDFASCCDLTQPTISHHLRMLREAGWVTSDRRASRVWYRLRPEALQRYRTIGEGIAPASMPAARSRRLSVVQPRG